MESPEISAELVKELLGVTPPKAIEVGLTTAVMPRALARTLKLCCTWVAGL